MTNIFNNIFINEKNNKKKKIKRLKNTLKH